MNSELQPEALLSMMNDINFLLDDIFFKLDQASVKPEELTESIAALNEVKTILAKIN